MAITAVFDGYVVKEPFFGQGDYGKFAEVTLRIGIAGREVHYVTGRFYGRKISVVRDYVHNGNYMTMTGSINSIQHRTKEGGIKYCQLYIKDAFLTIPPKVSSTPSFNPTLPEPTPYRLDEPEDSGDNEVQF